MASRVVRPPTAFSLDPSDAKQKRIEDPAHLAFIRKLPSVISGRKPCEACHIRSGSPQHRKKRTGARQRPDDAWTLPLHHDEHQGGPDSQHNMNEMEFWRSHGIDPFAMALELYHVTGDERAAKKIILDGIRRRRAGK